MPVDPSRRRLPQESVDDWLKDRWQATPTGNMQGKPLPLPQWLRVELAHPVTFIESAVVDFETAFADAYTIEVASQPGGPWETVAKVSPDTGPTAVHRLPDQKHVVHTVDIRASAGELSTNPITFARLSLTHAGTGWGVSVWRFELHGS